MMEIKELRAKHPEFHYQKYSLKQTGKELIIDYDFFLEPDIRFNPRVVIPIEKPVSADLIEPYVFNLGLVEAISYWKSSCAPIISIETGFLNPPQIIWWHDLFIHGLGEFFYRNHIDFSQPDFLIFRCHSRKGGNPSLKQTKTGSPIRACPREGVGSGMTEKNADLILVGGGKDSIVTLELTKELNRSRQVMLLNPTQTMMNVVSLAGFSDPIIIKRTIDPTLLKLNNEGYLNGHTPFSAYLAFLSILVGKLHGFANIINSSEESAETGNVVFHGLEVNHQYSKSFRFEKMFREYCNEYLNPLSNTIPNYFSFLRPLSELQIARLFSKFDRYFPVFNSCNIGRGAFWCGKCPKCAFVFLILSPFVTTQKLLEIFGYDLFDDGSLKDTFAALLGLTGFKPFECVGTKAESQEAVTLTINKYQQEGRETPATLDNLKNKLGVKDSTATEPIILRLKSHWNQDNFLPAEYAKVLKEAIKL